MKRVLAVVLCLCLAFTLSVTAFAVGSPSNKVVVRKGVGTKQDGTVIPVDTFVDISDDSSVTIVADEKTYGKFDGWTIYLVNEDGTYTEAKPGVDYTVKEGDLSSDKLVIVPINKIAVAGNYAGKITDPAKSSDVEGTKKDSPKTGDIDIMYAVAVLLAAGAVIFGAKRQLSK